MIWQWLSFCDPALATGEQFLGVAIVQAEDIVSGTIEAHRLKINPGGQVSGITVPEDVIRYVPQTYRNRLLTRQECETLNTTIREAGEGSFS